eukprot:jgi/Phyca11/117800/e_gw1.34.357.1
MLRLVEKVLPLGKGEWERLAASFNASKPRGAPERDYESLRRKFKQLYSTRKPTGVATMPPHVQKAKEAKQAIHDKANVIELDDEATILLMREETERKAEARREEEEQRRRDELAVMEARRLAEKAEAEERRRVDRQDMEERARRDREEARARTQELVMLLGALTKKE